jgi:diguanylate cyclase (GGDEF)-like protein
MTRHRYTQLGRNPQYLLGISEDITERKRTEARITHMAHHDAITGLANRILLRMRLDEALSRMIERDSHLAVHYIDLDYFKDVNDALGHPAGDTLLRQVAERLSSCVSAADMVARLGGDEFAIIQDEIENSEKASALARRIVEVIEEPYHVDGQEVLVTASVGIAVAPNDGADPDNLLKYADMALYAAKADGRRTYRFFETEMSTRLHDRRALENDLRMAFARNEFEMYYQPLVKLATADIVGFEALLRWNHPQWGVIAPGDFIAVAENIGLIVPLGEWVLRQACAEATNWSDSISVAVNLSPVQFKNGHLAETVIMALASSGLSATRLELEITETVLLQENDNNLKTLHQLRNLGVRIGLDDFGTGYSSLGYLRMFPFDRIKIDGSFVKELPDNAGCVSIVHAIIVLSEDLHMATTAEGAETAEQYEHLKANGCVDAQGFFFSPPRKASDIGEFLVQRRHLVENAA